METVEEVGAVEEVRAVEVVLVLAEEEWVGPGGSQGRLRRLSTACLM